MLGLNDYTCSSDTVFFSPLKLAATFPYWASNNTFVVLGPFKGSKKCSVKLGLDWSFLRCTVDYCILLHITAYYCRLL